MSVWDVTDEAVDALVTTPESLNLMLTREDAAARLNGIHTVVVDESNFQSVLESSMSAAVVLAFYPAAFTPV